MTRLWTATLVLALATIIGGAAAAANEQYTWAAADGTPFTVKDVSLHTDNPDGFSYGAKASVVISGEETKTILAGTVKYKIYEDFVQHFTQQDSFPYFECTNKGCNPEDPIALHLHDPSGDGYQTEFSFTMPRPYRTGRFNMVVWGVDQDHTPYDFSVSIGFNYTGAEVEAALATPSAGLRGAMGHDIQAAVTPPTLASKQYAYNISNGAFLVDTVSMTCDDCTEWSAGERVTITMGGIIPTKHVLAGTVKFNMYEFGVPYFISEGNFPYFDCTNRGCNPADGIALTLAEPNSVPTAFKLSFHVTLASTPGGGNPYKLVIWGQDQDHYPYDFSSTIRFNMGS